MGRFARSWMLATTCWRILREDPRLAAFPVVSGIAVLAASIVFVVPGLLWGVSVGTENSGFQIGLVVLGVILCYIEYFLIIFCNAALVGVARKRLEGEDATIGDGFKIAFSRLPQILGWVAITATVGLILRALASNREGVLGIIGAIAASVVGLAWNILTYLVVPVLVVEKVGPIAAIKRSASLLRKTWGEQIIGSGGIGLVFGLIAFLIILVGGIITVVGFTSGTIVLGIVPLVVTVLAVVVVSLIATTLQGIYSAALYGYAVGGSTGSIDPALLQGAFRQKGSR
jgi:hypothetical protein